jgi:hypothetical protein
MEDGLPGFLGLGTAAAIAASAQYQRRVNEVNAALGVIRGART